MLHILGAGSLGLLWAARLQQAGIDYRLIVRNESQLRQWNSNGNRLVFDDGAAKHTLYLPSRRPTPRHRSRI